MREGQDFHRMRQTTPIAVDSFGVGERLDLVLWETCHIYAMCQAYRAEADFQQTLRSCLGRQYALVLSSTRSVRFTSQRPIEARTLRSEELTSCLKFRICWGFGGRCTGSSSMTPGPGQIFCSNEGSRKLFRHHSAVFLII